MEIRSLGYRTDVGLLLDAGSTVEDHDDHLVVRTPTNPGFWWGNFLLLRDAPAAGEGERWLERFAEAFPGADHRAIGIDGTGVTAEDAAPFTDLGLEAEVNVVMTAEAVHAPSRPNTEATYRTLTSDDDWRQQVELSLAGEPDYVTREYSTASAAQSRRSVEAGDGAWWGAFDGDRLLSSMGLFRASAGLARFQNVKTHPDARGRGLAGTLVHRVSRYGYEQLGARTLVMVADPDYLAIRVYRSVGFSDSERQLQVTHRHSESQD